MCGKRCGRHQSCSPAAICGGVPPPRSADAPGFRLISPARIARGQLGRTNAPSAARGPAPLFRLRTDCAADTALKSPAARPRNSPCPVADNHCNAASCDAGLPAPRLPNPLSGPVDRTVYSALIDRPRPHPARKLRRSTPFGCGKTRNLCSCPPPLPQAIWTHSPRRLNRPTGW